MITSHTPGPWRVTGPNIRAGDALVAVVEDHWADMPCPKDEKAANARLIAAAPDLLAALRELMQGVYDEFSCSHALHEAADRARAAIAAATVEA